MESHPSIPGRQVVDPRDSSKWGRPGRHKNSLNSRKGGQVSPAPVNLVKLPHTWMQVNRAAHSSTSKWNQTGYRTGTAHGRWNCSATPLPAAARSGSLYTATKFPSSAWEKRRSCSASGQCGIGWPATHQRVRHEGPSQAFHIRSFVPFPFPAFVPPLKVAHP